MTDPFDDHFPDCAEKTDGTRGHFCKQCSAEVHDYVMWPCPAIVAEVDRLRATVGVPMSAFGSSAPERIARVEAMEQHWHRMYFLLSDDQKKQTLALYMRGRMDDLRAALDGSA